MKANITLKSNIDDSVNFITPCENGGYFESRYVRRNKEKLAVYLSSQSGCNRGCKFCHLTATKQTMFTQSTIHDYFIQACKVKNHYNYEEKAKYVHFNFMARGEPLCNPSVLEQSTELLGTLYSVFESKALAPKFNISTIMPKGLNKPLPEIFPLITPTIYYSLYSLNPNFRKQWLPTAEQPEQAIKLLKEYQDFTKKLIRIHGCFIEDQNDDLLEVTQMFELIDDYKLKVGFNLVRYNPYDETSGKESPKLNIISTIIRDKVGVDNYKEITRVGVDVKASCGTFYE